MGVRRLRPKLWSADHPAQSAGSPNIDSTAVTWRILVTVVPWWLYEVAVQKIPDLLADLLLLLGSGLQVG